MLDEQYIKLVGSRLELFRPITRYKYQCRCPICGDSKKDRKKARGNFYLHKGSWLYKCFNCDVSMRVPTFIEKVAPDLYDDYVMGAFGGITQSPKNNTTQPPKNDTTQSPKFAEIDLPRLSDLPSEHPAVSYIQARQIPTKYFNDLYYAEQFKKWSVSIVPSAFSQDSLEFDDARIVIPFRDNSGRVFAFQGRALRKTKLKYLTVKIDPDRQKIYGLDRIDESRRVYVVEGPIDSLFLDNAVGTADASLDSLQGMFPDMAYVWDNEPRSPIIVKKMERALEAGEAIVVWERSNRFNDINDAIMNYGYTISSINNLIQKRTFTKIEALLELNNWRKT